MKMSLTVAQVDTELTNLGATFTPRQSIPNNEDAIMAEIEPHCIIFFHGIPAQAQHSAYVVTVGEGLGDTWIWACNAGVAALETKGGFDEVSLEQYFQEHTNITQVSFYKNIH
jgi:hypothetical protein